MQTTIQSTSGGSARRLSTAVLSLVLLVILGRPDSSEAIECWVCEGNYDTSSCGYAFVNDSTVSHTSCTGNCAAVTLAMTNVTRNCASAYGNPPVSGCGFGNNSSIFTCIHLCDTDYCNGAGMLPEKSPTPPTAYVITKTTTARTTTTTRTPGNVGTTIRPIGAVVVLNMVVFAITLTVKTLALF